MNILLGEHGQALLYGIIGVIMIILICALCEEKWKAITPEYKTKTSYSNRKFIQENKGKFPIICADEIIYTEYKNTRFNCKDFITAKDYQGNDITDRLNIYGNVDTSKKGLYKLRCVVISDNQLACTKFINVIVE